MALTYPAEKVIRMAAPAAIVWRANGLTRRGRPGMPSTRVWGPVILQAAESLVEHQINPGSQDLVETY
ncbi:MULTISPECIES: hypothetical protein [Pseudonocardia]|uniref:Uncharacterized protein n=1 Tax=Pseudonocardia saturnea TaxID=33909 RepID=A0ABQ0S2R6_9PSEU|nr:MULTISPECIES: hypothetical protein [Pseudonocardia]TDN75737.1 hypothetical protein C8E95_4920 [Pseudonocardia autotrophica]BBF99706.1 hypothetical protein Pdca_09160 [Pseudonocardia autotrophica]GEC27203.1 hypothetical protein PSA01_42320 [Pseudonocardia saturnea]